jgi:glycosyltransferase involved in cell wall biosynthesis
VTPPASFLVVTQYYPPERGAAQTRLGAVVAELDRRGHRVEVLTAIPNYPTGALFPGWSRRPVQVRHEGRVRVVRVWVWAAMGSGLGRLANYASFGLVSIVGLVRTRRADWTIVEYPTLAGALPAVLWCRLARRRVAVNVADLWVDAAVDVGVIPDGLAASGARRIESWMLRQADVVNAVTDGVAEAVAAKGVAPDRIVLLPNGADTDRYAPGPEDPTVRSELGAAPDERIVLYAGTHGYVHGLGVALDAAELLADERVRFVLVGGGSEKDDLVADAARRGLRNVTFLDPVDPERIADYLRATDVGLATVRPGDLYRSVRSAKMLPVLSSATPIAYSADDEGSKLVAAAGAGRVTPAGDAPSLAAAIRALLDDPAEAAACGARGRAWVEANASWRSIIGGWLASIDEGSERRGSV